ncbi:MAG: hypothetical protein NC132_06270 [Corallococcus sp.]|nr:hypothetical protein [Corallococcus sp.]MCM1359786.1 hypothetical protein [Corallococcus sp.]MCM1395688.1 hypothetical protein [Corallococcus sp.]
MRVYLNDDWTYYPFWNDGIASGTAAKGCEKVRLPHANVTTPFNCFDESIYQFVCGYSRKLHLKEKGGKYLLTFDGVAHRAEVYVNGELCAVHNCGYTAFTADVTDFLHVGDNLLCVKVDAREDLDQPPFGFVIDYLTYGGIYREVYLDNYRGTYVADAFVTAAPDEPLKVRVDLGEFTETCQVLCEVLDGETTVFSSLYDATSAQLEICENLALKLWSVDEPNLYGLRLTVCGNAWQTAFGVRKARFTKDGFFLNGKRLKIVGLNRHQSFPYVGYAMPESMQRRDAQILKNKLCVNAVRTSHYPQSQYFLDECDRLGLLVFTEIPGWQHIGDSDWKMQAVENVKDMVLQNRNHPSVVLWGVRINESLDCDGLYAETNAVAHELDATRQTGGVRYLSHSHLLEDVYTYNDFNRAGATDRKKICGKDAPYLISEYNGHMFPTKSFDAFPHRREHMLRYARMLDGVYKDDSICGAFGWCMFDYNTHKDFGSGDRVCYHGVTDMFRNVKSAASVFVAQGKDPFLDVAFTTDIGDYPEGNVGEMYCLTNADYVDVFKGKSFVKRYTHGDSPFKHLPNPPILIDDLIGERLVNEDGFSPKHARLIKKALAAIRKHGINNLPLKAKLTVARVLAGTRKPLQYFVDLYGKYESNWGSAASALTLKAYKNGDLIAEKTVGSACEWHLDVRVSHTALTEKTTYDVAAVNFVALDQNGNVAPYICKTVHLHTEGTVQLIGPADVALYGGMGGTFVKSVGKKGKGKLFVDGIAVDFIVE